MIPPSFAQQQDSRDTSKAVVSITNRKTSENTENVSKGDGNETPSKEGLGKDKAAPRGQLDAPDLRTPRVLGTPYPPGQFQTFVETSYDLKLHRLGSNFFVAGLTSYGDTFAPSLNSPVPPDYTLGPGDELLIRGWGGIEVDFRAVVDRNGVVAIPRVGAIPLAGVKAKDIDGVLHSALSRNYKNFELSVTLGRLRDITVFVVGQAVKPGTYDVSATTTLVHLLFASGGPNANGSMRQIQVKRDGKVVTEIDLYAFLIKGEKNNDIRLLNGDVIFIPPVNDQVAVIGAVDTPTLLELSPTDKTVESVLSFIGKTSVLSDLKNASVEGFDKNLLRPRYVKELDIANGDLKYNLKDGDVLTMLPISREFNNAVTVRGTILKPAHIPFKPKMRITDVIPDREFLIASVNFSKLNRDLVKNRDFVSNASSGKVVDGVTQTTLDELRESLDRLSEVVNLNYAVVERFNRETFAVDLIPFNLGEALTKPGGADNLELQHGDIVTVFSSNDSQLPMARRPVFVRIEGEVQNPGIYQMPANSTLHDLIKRAGGITKDAYLFGTEFYRESAKKTQQENLSRIIRRLEESRKSRVAEVVSNRQSGQTSTDIQLAQQMSAVDSWRSIRPTGRVALNLSTEVSSVEALPRLSLQKNDRLLIPPQGNFVYVQGAVGVEAALLWEEGKTVNDYLRQAGVSVSADLDAVFLLRADGSVRSNEPGWFGTKVGNLVVMPGGIIVVPEKVDFETGWTRFVRGFKDWTQILYQLGLSAASIKVLLQ